jgi:hypothetical protein
MEAAMACNGEACLITKYTFSWASVTVTAATGTLLSPPKPPAPPTVDVLSDVQKLDQGQTNNGNPNGFTGAAVSKKAEGEEKKTLPKKIIKNKASTYTFVDASCGPGDGQKTQTDREDVHNQGPHRRR